MSDRGTNLDKLLANGYDLATAPADPLPKYASIVGSSDLPIDESRLVFLHPTTERPCPEDWAWMGCYDLDTGWRL